jgi:hypothetical protein
MAYEMVMPYHLHMPSYFLETFTEYPSVCVYKSKERYGRGKSLSTLHFYCPPN